MEAGRVSEVDVSINTTMSPSYQAAYDRTRDWRLFNVVLLGITFLFVFTAFQTCSMMQVCSVQCALYITAMG